MRKAALWLGLAFILGTGIVLGLALRAGEKPEGSNGFRRIFRTEAVLQPIDTLNLKYDSYYIAGRARQTLYLGNIVAPRHAFAVNIQGLDTQRIEFKLNNPEGVKFTSVDLRVDSPYFYLVDGSVPAIFEGKLNEKQAAQSLSRPPYFLELAPVGSNSFVIRSLDSHGEAQLGKLRLKPLSADFPRRLLEKQIDGVFCTEGMIHFDKGANRLVYVYFYRNQYIVTDSSFSAIRRFETIDTNSVAKIHVSEIHSSHTRTFSAPPISTNRRSDFYNGYLFVNSSLMADNEMPEFAKASVVDVYNTSSANYEFSFYIPEYNGGKLRGFSVYADRLIALYEGYLILYEFTPLTKL